MKLTFPIAADYVPRWGLWEGLRELIQNALDAEDAGHRAVIEYNARAKTLTIRSEGVTLSRTCLLLGGTDGKSEGARGQHREGLKLALLVLARSNVTVKIRNGNESWSAALEQVPEYPNQQVLVVSIRVRQADAPPAFEAVVGGVAPETWSMCQKRVLHLARPGPIFRKGREAVLFDAAYKGHVYVRGLYVTTIPELLFGYDLDIYVTRDREVADMFLLRYHAQQILDEATKDPVYRTVVACAINNGDGGELDTYNPSEAYRKRETLVAAVVDEFSQRHGPAAVPVASDQEASAATAAGFHPVQVHKSLYQVLTSSACGLDRRLAKTPSYGPVPEADVSPEVMQYIEALRGMVLGQSAVVPHRLRNKLTHVEYSPRALWIDVEKVQEALAGSEAARLACIAATLAAAAHACDTPVQNFVAPHVRLWNPPTATHAP